MEHQNNEEKLSEKNQEEAETNAVISQTPENSHVKWCVFHCCWMKQDPNMIDGASEGRGGVHWPEMEETLNTERSQNGLASEEIMRQAKETPDKKEQKDAVEEAIEELSQLQDKPNINKKSKELAIAKNKGVQLHNRIQEEVVKKKERLLKLRQKVQASKEEKERKEAGKCTFSPEISKNTQPSWFSLKKTPESSNHQNSPEKISLGQNNQNSQRSPGGFSQNSQFETKSKETISGKNEKSDGAKSARERPRSANEFFESMLIWTEKKNQKIAQMQIVKNDKEREELSYQPNANIRGKSTNQRIPKEDPHERLFEGGRLKQEKKEKLVDDFVSQTCTFKPKINAHSNRIIKHMEKRDLIKRTKRQVESEKEGNGWEKTNEETGNYYSASSGQNQLENKLEEAYSSYQGQKSKVARSPEKTAPIQPKTNGIGQKERGQHENQLDLSFGKEKTKDMPKGKINVIQFQPKMGSILNKVSQEKAKVRSVTPKTFTKQAKLEEEERKAAVMEGMRGFAPINTQRKTNQAIQMKNGSQRITKPNQIDVFKDQRTLKEAKEEKEAPTPESKAGGPSKRNEDRQTKKTSGRINVIRKK